MPGPSFMSQRTLRGFVLGECMSAVQKAIRRGDEMQAVTWAVEMDQSGHGQMLWNRLLVIASEDVGLAAPLGFQADIRALYDTWRELRDRRNQSKPERLQVLHAVMLLCRAPKSRKIDNAVWATYGNPDPLVSEIPDYAIDGHTARGRSLGRGNTTATSPESYHVENPGDDGGNPYFQIKEDLRARIGMQASRSCFHQQGRRTDAAADRAQTEPEQEALL